MPKNLRRTLLALAFSVSGIFATQTWYKMASEDGDQHGDQKALARVVSASNEVHRRPARRLIWRKAGEQENLFAGEALRTAEDSEAVVEFFKDGNEGEPVRLDLEPESVVVIEDDGGQLALNFLEGNALLRGAEQIAVKADGKVVKTGSGTLSLNRSESGLVTRDLNAQDGLLIQSPTLDEVLYLDIPKKEKAVFSWKKLEAYSVLLEAGRSRKEMKPVPGASANGSEGKLEAALPPGRHYFRLLARPNNPELPVLESAVQRFMIAAKAPPTLVFPSKSAKVIPESSKKSELKLKWTNPGQLENFVVEVSEDPQFQKVVTRSEPLSKTEWVAEVPKAGRYYWRATGYTKKTQQPLSSPALDFQWSPDADLAAPLLLAPEEKSSVSFSEFQKSGIFLSWAPTPGARSYFVKVVPVDSNGILTKERDGIEKEGNATSLRIRGLKPGLYRWSLVAKNGETASSESTPRSFELRELPGIPWSTTQSTYFYDTDEPQLKTSWKKESPDIQSFRIRVYRAGDDPNQVEWSEPSSTEFLTKVPTPGEYRVELEGLNDKKEVVARANTRPLRVAPSPRLDPPQWARQLPSTIQAEKTGAARLAWEKVDLAESYLIQIRSPAGEIVKEVRATTEASTLTSLKPGEYKVGLRAVSKEGRNGELSEQRTLLVPQTSSLKAPKVKRVKIN